MQYNFEDAPAVRKKTPLKISISGVSGSGKTYSSLLLARGLSSSWDKIGVIDTEANSSALYAQISLDHLPDGSTFRTLKGGLQPPYEPEKFIAAMNHFVRQGMETIIIDSASKEWDGKGGILEMSDSGNFRSWAEITPKHTAFLEAIVNCPVHLITTLRSKADYTMEQDQSSKRTKVKKLGTKAVQRDGFEYEVTLGFNIHQNNHVTCEKDRTKLFHRCNPFVITPDHGKQLLDWSNSGFVDPEIVYTATGPEKDVLFRLMRKLRLSDMDDMRAVEAKIRELKPPMKRFEELATEIINRFIQEKNQ